jgi:hypothetical protein
MGRTIPNPNNHAPHDILQNRANSLWDGMIAHATILARLFL